MQVLGLFSKVVGAQPQGTLLGWFGSAGSLARIGFPVIAGKSVSALPFSFFYPFAAARSVAMRWSYFLFEGGDVQLGNSTRLEPGYI